VVQIVHIAEVISRRTAPLLAQFNDFISLAPDEAELLGHLFFQAVKDGRYTSQSLWGILHSSYPFFSVVTCELTMR